MSSRPSPLTPSPSHFSHTLNSTHTHYQHISPHRHIPHWVQAGSGNPTAKKTYIKHFSYRKLQTCLSPFIHSEKHSNVLSSTRSHCFFHKTTNQTLNCTTLSHWNPVNWKSWFQIISPHSDGSTCRFWHCQSSDPPVHPLITVHH